MDAIRKTLAVALKDLQVMASDRAYVLSMLIFPIVIAAFSGASFRGGDSAINLPAILVNQDAGAYGDSIAKVLADIPEVGLTKMDSPSAAQEQMGGGEYLAAVLIPADFTQRINDYEQAEITVIVDPAQADYSRIFTTIMDEIAGAMAIQGEIRYGIRTVLAGMGLDETSNPERARAAQAQVEGVLFTQLQRMETDAPIQVQRETLQGAKLFTWDDPFTLLLPAFTVMFAFFVIPALATELLKEKEAGSLRRLMAAPLPRGSLIGGKVLASLLLVVLQVVILFGIGGAVLDMSLGKSPLGLIAVTLALGLAATTLGMLVAALARSVDQAGSIGLLLIFVLGFLGGSFNPDSALYRAEGPLALLSRYTPQAQATMAYHALMIQNGGLVDVLPYVGYLLALSLVFFMIAIWRFRFE